MKVVYCEVFSRLVSLVRTPAVYQGRDVEGGPNVMGWQRFCMRSRAITKSRTTYTMSVVLAHVGCSRLMATSALRVGVGVPVGGRDGSPVGCPVGGEVGGPVDGPVGGEEGGPVDGPVGGEDGGAQCRRDGNT